MLVAGKGSRLHPITLAHPKSLFMLDDNITVIERMVSQICKFDNQAEIIAITGFMYKAVSEKIKKFATVVYNPFYAVTNSLGSLWFARDLLDGDCVLINGDIVMEDNLVCDYVCHKYTHPTVLLDSSIKKDGDYNVQVANGSVVKKGDKIVVLEAMKMENDIVAPVAGTITFAVKAGDNVETGARLASIN